MAFVSRARPGHDQLARDRLRSRRRDPSPSRRRSSGRSFRSPAGSSTTRTRSGRRSSGVAARGARASAGVARDDVAAIGITNQRETTRRLGPRDRRARSANAIVWQDRRTRRLCERLQGATGTSAMIRAQDRPGARRLLLRHQARMDARQRARRARARASAGELAFGTVDTLAGLEAHRRRACTSPTSSNASRTLLFDIHTRRLGRRAADAASTSRARCCRRCASSSEVYGETTRLLGVDAIPIAGIAGDQQAALFGQACFEPGMAKNTYGTGCFLLHEHRHEADRVDATSC